MSHALGAVTIFRTRIIGLGLVRVRTWFKDRIRVMVSVRIRVRIGIKARILVRIIIQKV